MFGDASDPFRRQNEVGCVDMQDMADELRNMEWNESDHVESHPPSDVSSVSTSSSADSHDFSDAKEAKTKDTPGDKGNFKSEKIMHSLESVLDKNPNTSADEDDEDSVSQSDFGVENSDSVLERTIEFTLSDESDFVSVQYGEPTPLYRAIEEEDWSSILTFLKTDEWGWKCSMFCDSYYTVNEKGASGQARTWVGTTDEEGEICRLPLHAAIVRQAPYQVIHTLTKLYRKGVRYPDSDGNYPLHLAFHVGAPLRIVVLLLKEYPAAINKRNAEDCLPDECGMGNEIGDVLRMCIEETRTTVTKQVLKEKKKPMEDERKQLIEVTAELMQLKKLVSERERNVAKENFMFQRNQLSGAISELTRLKLDLEKHEESLLKHSLDEERKRTEEVVTELLQTKKELETVKETQKKIHKTKSQKKNVPDKRKQLRLRRKPLKKAEKGEDKNLVVAFEKEIYQESQRQAEETEIELEKKSRKELENTIKARSKLHEKQEEMLPRNRSKPKDDISGKQKDDINMPRNSKKQKDDKRDQEATTRSKQDEIHDVAMKVDSMGSTEIVGFVHNSSSNSGSYSFSSVGSDDYRASHSGSHNLSKERAEIVFQDVARTLAAGGGRGRDDGTTVSISTTSKVKNFARMMNKGLRIPKFRKGLALRSQASLE